MRGSRLGLYDPAVSRPINKTNFHVMMLDAKLAALQVRQLAQIRIGESRSTMI
jgi:hypothetical protein